MRWAYIAAGLSIACLAPASHAATTFSEGFDDISTLAGAGWVFTNASTPAGDGWFQGNSGIFAAQSGSPGSYVAANFNSTTALSGSIDNWLISPVLSLAAGSTLQFDTQASDAGFFDLLEIRFSSGPGSDISGFATLVGSIGSAASATYPVGGWTAYTMALPTAAAGRFAFRYSVADATNASYIGIDSLTVNGAVVGAVPEPATAVLLVLGLAAVGAARRRRPDRPSALLTSA